MRVVRAGKLIHGLDDGGAVGGVEEQLDLRGLHAADPVEGAGEVAGGRFDAGQVGESRPGAVDACADDHGADAGAREVAGTARRRGHGRRVSAPG
ncbi:hypothetical protein [Streptomyces sp. NPDC057429]|uniref:hypothetical protein n=1 Tax=Streptomyces sp. NPDC057429 TaxID=3346130 RepID=UPI0036B9D10B